MKTSIHPSSTVQPHRRAGRYNTSGVALVIVLAFVVLLTGLIVAFFSRSINQRQISNASVNQVKVQDLASGALETITGDLMQEIAAGSNVVTTGSTTYYQPKTPATAVPCPVGFAAGTVGLENLVKRSAYNQPFYPTANYDGNASNRAVNLSSATPATNSHYISPARWNSHFLLAKSNTASDTDFTPVQAFAVPDWVLVKRNEDPAKSTTTWDSSLTTTGSNPVVGRYSYAIYNEGGLLDMNVGGYPSLMATGSAAYKNALSFADLTQLPGISALPVATQNAVINDIVGFRNYGGAAYDPIAGGQTPLTGSFPALVWSATNASNYYRNVLSNSNGFVGAAPNIPLVMAGNPPKAMTDHPFVTRQEFIRTLLQFIATNPADRANLQNALQYLGTFSRTLNQPSYGPDPGRPLIANSSSGGNDAAGGDSLSLVTASGDARINPGFLNVRVVNPMVRSDGITQAIAGEPLVKKRFNLRRLAWLTYKGPSAYRTLTNPSSSGGDADISALESSYGMTPAWLQQGTDSKILAYFGLTWGPNPLNPGQNCWTYAHANPLGAINTLDQVARLSGANAREPDFVELLKASICAGSIAKPATIPPPSSGQKLIDSYSRQFPLDSSLDYAILQMVANIIDQYDCDGYPTTIYYNNSGNTKSFVGIENLPYINRIRSMVIKAAVPSATSQGLYGGGEVKSLNPYPAPAPVLNQGADTLTDTGVGLVMLYPELWNPHDWNPNNVDRTLGNPRPTQFKVTAESDSSGGTGFSYESYINGPPVLPGSLNAASGNSLSRVAVVSLSPGYTTRGLSPNFTPFQRYLTEANTALTFALPSDSTALPYFREPTMLFKPNVPAGLSVASPGLSSILVSEHLAQFVGSGNGLKSAVVDNNGYANGDAELQDPASQDYIGFYLGSFPLRWVAAVKDKDPSSPTVGGTFYYNFAMDHAQNNDTITDTALVHSNLTYRIRCQDANSNWIAYDQKYGGVPTSANPYLLVADYKGFFSPLSKNIEYSSTVDPRTSRFGVISCKNYYIYPSNNLANLYGDEFPPFVPGAGDNVGFLNRPGAIICSQRMGRGAGATFASDPTFDVAYPNTSGFLPSTSWWMTSAIGWYPGSSGATGFTTQGKALRPGLLTQNSPQIINDGQEYDGATEAQNRLAQYYTDADGVVRRAMGAYVTGTSSGGTVSSANTLTGLPMATANSGGISRTGQSSSRPMVLNHPFNSVADLGYVFSGTPWKNIDFFTPESGAVAVLDTFCVMDTDDANGLVAGKVDLNTRQIPVLQAILAGAYEDDWSPGSGAVAGGSGALAQTIAKGLVTRTSGTSGPLRNLSDLVGKWVSSTSASSGGIDGSKSYDGFSADLTALLPSNSNEQCVQRFREASIRALSNNGQTRVWNLMIDLVAQVGRYPQSATSLANFSVEGEQRCWVHLAIDRSTGQVIDRQIEVVKE